MHGLCSLALTLGMLAQTPAPPNPGEPILRDAPELRARLEELCSGVRGIAGIHVVHLTRREEVAIRADEAFPTASLVKLPILLALFEKLVAGELDWHQELRYDAQRGYPGEDLLAAFRDGEKITLAKLVTLMIGFSDNTASLWLQELAGTGTTINAWLAGHGFETTRVNSRTPGREEDWKRYGWGQTSPREMTRLVLGIRDAAFHTRAASDSMLRVMQRSIWDGEAISQLPPHVAVCTKQGAVNASRSEVVLVEAPHGAFVFAVLTREQEDQSWTRDNEGYVLLRRVARTLYEHYEPDDSWRPAPEHERFGG